MTFAVVSSDWLQCIDARGPQLADEEMARVSAIPGHTIGVGGDLEFAAAARWTG